MSDVVLTALIVTAGPTLLGIFNTLMLSKNSKRIEEVHKATNSMKDELVQTTKLAAHAAGVLEEKTKQEKP